MAFKRRTSFQKRLAFAGIWLSLLVLAWLGTLLGWIYYVGNLWLIGVGGGRFEGIYVQTTWQGPQSESLKLAPAFELAFHPSFVTVPGPHYRKGRVAQGWYLGAAQKSQARWELVRLSNPLYTSGWGTSTESSFRSNSSVSYKIHCLSVPSWCPLLLGLIPFAALILRNRHPREGHCPKCRYDLTGNVSGRCPECGTPIADDQRAMLLQKADAPSNQNSAAAGKSEKPDGDARTGPA